MSYVVRGFGFLPPAPQLPGQLVNTSGKRALPKLPGIRPGPPPGAKVLKAGAGPSSEVEPDEGEVPGTPYPPEVPGTPYPPELPGDGSGAYGWGEPQVSFPWLPVIGGMAGTGILVLLMKKRRSTS